MARLPSRDDLPQLVARGSGMTVRPAQSNMGEAIMGFGVALGAQAKEDRKKQGIMERARATAYLQKQLMEGAANYTVQNKPDVSKWGDDFAKGSRQWREEAAKHITDPNDRELFMLQTEDDVTRYNINIRTGAQKIQNERQLESTKFSMDQLVESAALTKDENERVMILSRVRDMGKEMVDAGLMSPAAMADYDVKMRQRVAGLVVEQTIQTDPGLAYGALTNKPTASYVQKLGNKENAARNPKARPKNPDGSLASSALGLFQFTHDTWEDLRKKYPELGLSKSYGTVDNDLDGRLDKAQQYRAMEKLTELNAARLRENDIQVTEATLYLAHFAGVGGAVKLLQADPTAPADKLFPKEAASNPRHFMGKTVAGAIASLTKGFNGQPIKAGAEYASLSPEQRITLTARAKSAADSAWAQNKDEQETDMLLTIADEADAMSTREEALQYVAQAEASGEVRIKAEQLVNQRWNVKEKIEAEQKQAEFDTSFDAVQKAMAEGNQAAALDVIKKMKDPTNRDTLNKWVLNPPQATPVAMTEKINALRYSSDPEKQKQFMEINFGSPEYVGTMSPQDLQANFAAQQAAKERASKTGKDPVLLTTAQISESVINSMRLQVSGKDADEQDIAVADLLRGEIQSALEDLYKIKGDTLTQSEMNEAAQNAVIQWHQKSRIKLDSWWTAAEGSGARLVSDAFEEYQGKKKTLPLNVLQTQFLAAIEAAEKANPGKKYKRGPAQFAEFIYTQAAQKD